MIETDLKFTLEVPIHTLSKRSPQEEDSTVLRIQWIHFPCKTADLAAQKVKIIPMNNSQTDLCMSLVYFIIYVHQHVQYINVTL